MLESFVSSQTSDVWNDFVAVFVKEEVHAIKYPNRILQIKKDFYNGVVQNSPDFLNLSSFDEDQKKLIVIKQIIDKQIKLQ